MPTWPTVKAGTTHLDAGSDNPGSARADIKQNVDNVNDMIDTIVVTSPTATQVLSYDNGDSRFENVDIDTIAVTTSATQTLTNKTLTTPIISSISNTGTVTLPTSTDTLVGKATTDTLTNKTLTSPVISSISNTGTLTLPTSTDTLVADYTFQPSESDFPPYFKQTLVFELASLFAGAIARNDQLSELYHKRAIAQQAIAKAIDAQAQTTRRVDVDRFRNVRNVTSFNKIDAKSP